MVFFEEIKGIFFYIENIISLCYLQEIKGLVLSLLFKMDKHIV